MPTKRHIIQVLKPQGGGRVWIPTEEYLTFPVAAARGSMLASTEDGVRIKTDDGVSASYYYVK